MGCTFCATGTMGLTADLTAGEIVEQLVHARRVAQIRNIVFMVRLPLGTAPRSILLKCCGALWCPALAAVAQHFCYPLQGMGEPLNNYGPVRAAVGMMTDPRYFGL